MRDELSLEMKRLVERARRDESPANASLKRRVRHSLSLAVPTSAFLGSGLAAASGSAASSGTGAALGVAATGKASTGLLLGFCAWVAGGFAIGIGATTAYVGWVSPRMGQQAPPRASAASLATARQPGVTPRSVAAAATTIENLAPEPSIASALLGREAATNRAPGSSAVTNNAATAPGQAAADLRQVPSLADEVAQLARVQQALRDGQGRAALEAVDAAALRFAHGQLEPDFQAARVLAWCELGQTARARQAADTFLRVHVASPLAERVRDSCAFLEVESEPSTIGR